MNHIRRYNEESIFDIFKSDKSKMYITNPRLSDKRGGSPYLFYGEWVDSTFNNDHYDYDSSYIKKRAVFIKDYDNTFHFRDSVYKDEVWYDTEPIFKNLHKISDSIGYRIGEKVSVDSEDDGVISDIKEFAFYYFGIFKIKTKFTLLYKVNGSFKTINSINLIKGVSNNNIIDDMIKENFLELIDDNIIDYFSEKKISKGKDYFKCKVIIKVGINPDVLFKVSEALMIANNRLKSENIILNMKRIGSDEVGQVIEFYCHQSTKK